MIPFYFAKTSSLAEKVFSLDSTLSKTHLLLIKHTCISNVCSESLAISVFQRTSKKVDKITSLCLKVCYSFSVMCKPHLSLKKVTAHFVDWLKSISSPEKLLLFSRLLFEQPSPSKTLTFFQVFKYKYIRKEKKDFYSAYENRKELQE